MSQRAIRAVWRLLPLRDRQIQCMLRLSSRGGRSRPQSRWRHLYRKRQVEMLAIVPRWDCIPVRTMTFSCSAEKCRSLILISFAMAEDTVNTDGPKHVPTSRRAESSDDELSGAMDLPINQMYREGDEGRVERMEKAGQSLLHLEMPKIGATILSYPAAMVCQDLLRRGSPSQFPKFFRHHGLMQFREVARGRLRRAICRISPQLPW